MDSEHHPLKNTVKTSTKTPTYGGSSASPKAGTRKTARMTIPNRNKKATTPSPLANAIADSEDETPETSIVTDPKVTRLVINKDVAAATTTTTTTPAKGRSLSVSECQVLDEQDEEIILGDEEELSETLETIPISPSNKSLRPQSREELDKLPSVLKTPERSQADKIKRQELEIGELRRMLSRIEQRLESGSSDKEKPRIEGQ